MTAALQGKMIKSADRVLDILEMFTESRPAVTVMDVARALNAPQSSTSELLGSLVRRGYLVRRRGERVFRPTSRVALLGAWVHPALFRNGNLLPMMDSLRAQTGMGVVLYSMLGASLKQNHTVGPLPEAMIDGREQGLLHSPFGHVLLSTMFASDIRLLVHRLNAENDAEYHVSFAELQTRVDDVSRKGSALGPVAEGWSGIAVLLPQGKGEEQLAIGLVGETAGIEGRAEDLLRSLRQAIATHFGPRVASENDVSYPIMRQAGEKA